MESTNTPSIDLNHDASDQTLTQSPKPINVPVKQGGNQEPGVLIDKQSEVAPNREELVPSESDKGLEMEDNTRIGDERKVPNPEDGNLVTDARNVVGNEDVDAGSIPSGKALEMEIEAVGGVSGEKASMDKASKLWNSDGRVPSNDAPHMAGIKDGAVEIGACDFGASSSYSGDGSGAVGTSVVGRSPKKEGLATVNEDSVDVSELKASEQWGVTDVEVMELESTGTASAKKEDQESYSLPQEKKSEFSASDLIWGKVKGHPWWPGQIFDPTDSSELATKYEKKDCFLVAYFGDESFAWREVSQLKPFRAHFSEMEGQSISLAFLNAVNCALDEVSRRVELGLVCSCVPDEICAKIKYQKIQNAGIREGVTATSSVDMSPFEPTKLLEFVKELALPPAGGVEPLELVTAKAQIRSFYRSKGYFVMPAFHVDGGLAENDADLSPGTKPLLLDSGKEMKTGDRPAHRRNPIPEDSVHHKRKRKSLAELMSGKKASNGKATGNKGKKGKKCKVVDTFSDESMQTRAKRRASISDTDSKAPSARRSSIVGDRIRRVADQLTGSPPILKSSGERFQSDSVKVDSQREKAVHKVDSQREKAVHIGGSLPTPRETQKRRARILKEYSSPDELLSQLCLAARDPLKGYSFLAIIISFFTDFRNTFHQRRSGKKIGSGKTGRGKSSKSKTGSVESSELNDTDSDWTDKITHGSSKKAQKRRAGIPKEYSSPDVLLSQLCLAARDPMKGYSFLAVIVGFFTEFRNSFHQKRSSSGKRIGSGKTASGKSCHSKTGSVEEPSPESRKRKGESRLESPKKQNPKKQGKDDTGQIKDVFEVPAQVETEEQ